MMTALTIRERKNVLTTSIRSKIEESQNTGPLNQDLFADYKKILHSNGIKNARVINNQLSRLMALNLPKTAIYSNLKFLSLFRSRMTEEGIPLAEAELILQYVNCNLAEVNEDDDYIGDAALNYAELVAVEYNKMVASQNNCATFKLTDDQACLFNLLPITLPPA
jgi:hypothetical protein